MNLTKLFYFLIIACQLLGSCKPMQALEMMKAEEADYETWKNADGKSVVFVPMVHAGKPEFYEDVKNIIAAYKSEGYVVFYEGLKKEFDQAREEDTTLYNKYVEYAKMHFPQTDSIDQLVCLLKLKRMMGMIPDSASYSRMLKSLSMTNKAVFQPSIASLGISAADVNVDVSLAELVDEYENQFGTITLEQIDFAIPLDETLPGHRRLKKKNKNIIIIDYRDKNLSNNIQSRSYNKILVIYGLAHKNGTFNALKKADPSWKVLKP